MISTTGVLFFYSGYTTNVSTDRLSCFTVTHSRCRGDFSSLAFAQSCAEATGAIDTNKSRAAHFIAATSTKLGPKLYQKKLACCEWPRLSTSFNTDGVSLAFLHVAV
jgi:hypothetical protein